LVEGYRVIGGGGVCVQNLTGKLLRHTDIQTYRHTDIPVQIPVPLVAFRQSFVVIVLVIQKLIWRGEEHSCTERLCEKGDRVKEVPPITQPSQPTVMVQLNYIHAPSRQRRTASCAAQTRTAVSALCSVAFSIPLVVRVVTRC
jgi:hypothetical protein